MRRASPASTPTTAQARCSSSSSCVTAAQSCTRATFVTTPPLCHATRRSPRSSPGGLDSLYLDTTYLDPSHRFPTQSAAVQHVVDTCRLLLPAQRTLVLFGSYSIGKERVFMQVGKDLGVRIHAERPKMRLLECMELPAEEKAVLTFDAAATRWRVVPMAHLRADKLRSLLGAMRDRFDAVVAFRPSGWCFGRGGGAAGRSIKLSNNVTIVEVPYSEHSSFDELCACVRDLRPRKVVATVDGGPLGNRHKGMAHLLEL